MQNASPSCGNLCNEICPSICITFPQVCSLPCCLFLAASFYLPESPLWLVKTGHESEAEQSIKRIRGEKYQQSHEIKELIMCTLVVAQPTAVSNPDDPDSSPLRRRLARAKSSVESKLSVITSPDVWKPMALMMLMFSFQARRKKISYIFSTFFMLESFKC